MEKLDKALIVMYIMVGVCALMSIILTLIAGEVSVMSHCFADASIILLVTNLIMARITHHMDTKNQADKDNSDDTKKD